MRLASLCESRFSTVRTPSSRTISVFNWNCAALVRLYFTNKILSHAFPFSHMPRNGFVNFVKSPFLHAFAMAFSSFPNQSPGPSRTGGNIRHIAGLREIAVGGRWSPGNGSPEPDSRALRFRQISLLNPQTDHGTPPPGRCSNGSAPMEIADTRLILRCR